MMKIESLKITPEILKLIAEVDEFKGTWKAVGTIAPERLKVLRRSATIESVGASNRIEGNRLADHEVLKLLSNDVITVYETRDEQEVVGYAEVMKVITQSWDLIPLDHNHIKQFHADLLKFSDKDTHHRGEYKKISNSIMAFDAEGKQRGVVSETASPFDTPRLMDELISWTNNSLDKKSLHPLLSIAVFVVVFLKIHPFHDGNGRLSRILTSLLLLKAGYSYTPYASLEKLIEESQTGYYLALRQTEGLINEEDPNWQPWIRYFVDILALQTRRLTAKMEQERIFTAHLPKLSLDILDQARKNGRISLSDMMAQTSANRNTLKKHFKKLLSDEFLVLRGAGRASWYEPK